VDAGLSRKETFQRLTDIGENPDELTGIVVTHEHSDHVCGLISIAKYFQNKQNRSLPLYLSRLTAPTLDWGEFTPAVEHFQAGRGSRSATSKWIRFTIPHDAADPVGLTFCAEGVRIGVVTDLGYMPDSIKFHLRGMDVLLLEANHDLDMLKVGPYPWSVKQRVMGRKGHLSNDVACEFIKKRPGHDGEHADPGAPQPEQQPSGNRAADGESGIGRPRAVHAPYHSRAA
jgi:phosphoribosyl 1,2-cyclic phosphodiesterase